ncbi:MAG TPA: sulfotransferase domain-containing protein [Tepidisphaeraceae bacterium]|nr:sulfotransferase domain-containing protein [Tepidisphaeraceae bacterium]
MNPLIDAIIPWLPMGLRRAVRRRWINPAIEHYTGLRPVSSPRPEDVFICGYPRSGNTWFQYLISAVVHGVNGEHASDALANFLVTDVHVHGYYCPLGPVSYIRTHFLPRPEYRRIVYLLRDGRDAMVSYHLFECAMRKKQIDFLQALRGNDFFPCSWQEHVEAYLANPFKAQMLTIRYEELHADPAGQMRRFVDFVGLDCDDNWIATMTQTTIFEKMRRREEMYGWANPNWTADKRFIRRGKIGSYKDEMPADVLAAFLAQAGGTLRRCGYL